MSVCQLTVKVDYSAILRDGWIDMIENPSSAALGTRTSDAPVNYSKNIAKSLGLDRARWCARRGALQGGRGHMYLHCTWISAGSMIKQGKRAEQAKGLRPLHSFPKRQVLVHAPLARKQQLGQYSRARVQKKHDGNQVREEQGWDKPWTHLYTWRNNLVSKLQATQWTRNPLV